MTLNRPCQPKAGWDTPVLKRRLWRQAGVAQIRRRTRRPDGPPPLGQESAPMSWCFVAREKQVLLSEEDDQGTNMTAESALRNSPEVSRCSQPSAQHSTARLDFAHGEGCARGCEMIRSSMGSEVWIRRCGAPPNQRGWQSRDPGSLC